MSTIAAFDDDIVLSRKSADTIDWTLLLSTLMLTVIGFISIYSATYDAGASSYFNKQLMFGAIGLGLMVTLIYIPERWLYSNTWLLYGFTVVLLIAVLTPLGKEVYGQKNWLVIGGIQFQPSELAKFGTLVAIARYLSQKGKDLRTIRDLGIVFLITALPIGLIMLEPDTGSASVFGAILLGIYLWGGADLFLLYTGVALPFIAISSLFTKPVFYAVLGVFSIGALFFRRNIILTAIVLGGFAAVGLGMSSIFTHLPPHQQSRIQTFLNPDLDPRGKGYHVIQSMMAVGSGGLLGKGFLQGTQTQMRYIPKQWTDFIFCVPTEEFGFVGGVIVIILLAVVIARAVKIAGYVRSKFASTIAIGIATVFFYHMLVNIGMAIGLFPVMGIPLPFVSAGGSALMVNMCLIGLLLNFYRTRKRAGA